MKILPFGERAILVEFDQEISEEINDQVFALQRALESSKLKGISYFIPAYSSLTVGFDPNQIRCETLVEAVEIALSKQDDSQPKKQRKLHIPVCYEAPFALDLEDVKSQTGLSEKEIIDLHSGNSFRVYMMGFLPGFAYMGKTDSALEVDRKSTPRLVVPQGAVGLAGNQTGIYPNTSPGGWQIIGQTPIPLIKPDGTFLFEAGDEVVFESISKAEFYQIQTEIQNEKMDWRNVYV